VTVDNVVAAPSTRIAIADDSWHYARALEAALELEVDFEIVSVSYPATDVVAAIATESPSVLLLGLDLADGGIRLLEQLRNRMPDVAVVVVTAEVDEPTALACLAAGARGYVIKHDHTDPDRIATAIRSAARGDMLLDRSVQNALRDLATRAPDAADEAGLTPRERDVLPLIAEGLQNKQIARALELSEQTVRNHLSSVYRKLGTSNRTETIAVARRRGILP